MDRCGRTRPGSASILDSGALAHATPIYIDVAGRRVARKIDAAWCLALIDRLEVLIAEHGQFHPRTREERLQGFDDLLDEARRFYRRVEARATA